MNKQLLAMSLQPNVEHSVFCGQNKPRDQIKRSLCICGPFEKLGLHEIAVRYEEGANI